MTENQFLRIFKSTNLLIGSLAIYGDGVSPQIVTDPSQPEGQRQRRGQFFISLPTNLAEVLPGSICLPADFCESLGPRINFDYLHQRLIGDSLGNENNPAFNLVTDGFALRVFHGSFNSYALEISRLAALGFRDPPVRGQYQTHLFEIMKPIINKPSEFDLRIIEDCLASGDTLVGVIALFYNLGRVSPQTKIRIDVAVATTQGVLVLQRFAKDNNLPIELNVGNLAYGLSSGTSIEGVEKVRAHANYIVYPREVLSQLSEPMRNRLESYRADDSNIYVVGDMGDAAKSLPMNFEYPWNRSRNDDHGERIDQQPPVVSGFQQERPTNLYLTNGGWLMDAYFKYLNPKADVNRLIFSAKRVWSSDPKYGYGVLVDRIPNLFLSD